MLECCSDTLNTWCKRTYKDKNGHGMGFSEAFAIKRQKGKVSLRRTQFQLAEKNTGMAIWLGKQYLGQKEPDSNDKPEQGVTIVIDV